MPNRGDRPVVGVTITGAPGAGKSKIATMIAEALKEKGVTVNYVNKDLAVNPTTFFASYERYLNWIRDHSPVVVIDEKVS